MTEVWLRGPLEGIAAELQPVVQALLQIDEEIAASCSGLSTDALWTCPGGAASTGFHLRHLAGTLDRLLTYVEGLQLTPQQLQALKRESEPGVSQPDATSLVADTRAAIASAIERIRAVPIDRLDDSREVGRRRLPTTVRGLLVHIAEHSARHAGQIATTIKVVQGLAAS